MDDGIIYLNNAATTWPKPCGVIEEVNRSLRLPYFEEGRTTLCEQIDYSAVTREDLARFFHAPDPSHFIFTQNATDSLNFAIHGFGKKMGRPFHVITTELEHNAVLRPLRTLDSEGRITLSVVPFAEGYVGPDAVMDAITPETRLAVITQGAMYSGPSRRSKRSANASGHRESSSSLTAPRPQARSRSTSARTGSISLHSPDTKRSSAFRASGDSGFVIRDLSSR